MVHNRRVQGPVEPPLRIFFGKAPLDIATKDYQSRLATWNKWQPVSEQAQGG